jgi:hypothetical protein
MRTFSAAFIVILALGLGGCATGDKEAADLNRQNKHAGALIEQRSDDPVVKQAGKDVKENATVIEKIKGEPATDVPYSPEASGAAREAGEKAGGWNFWGTLGGIAVTIGSLALAFLKTTAAKTAIEAVEVLVASGQKVKASAAAGTLTPEQVTETYKAAVALAPPAAKAKIEETLVRVKQKIEAVAPTVTPVTTSPTSTT